MSEKEIAKQMYNIIISNMEIQNINLTKLSEKLGIADSTLSHQLKKLQQGKFISIKSLRVFEKALNISLIFFEK